MEQRINIFLTEQQKIKLNNLKYKYRLSITTIVKILVKHYEAMPPLNDLLNGKALLKGNKKTSIRLDPKGKSYPYYHNAVQLFFNKDLVKAKLLETYGEKVANNFGKLQNMIYNDFANTIDDYYDWNHFIRQQASYERKVKA